MTSGQLRLTLLADGPSDRCLLVLLRWLVGQIVGSLVLESAFADLRPFDCSSRLLSDRIPVALKYYPCDVLFVHRDAEREPAARRFDEIVRATEQVQLSQPWVGVVPVRMTEAWLLAEERAIRLAADTPNGSAPLRLPGLSELEKIPDPKRILHEALEAACEKKGRRLERFRRDLAWRSQRVAELVQEPGRLLTLAAFRRLEADTRRVIERLSGG
jgi:hypothetical protein